MSDSATSLSLAARLARRELRGGIAGFRVFIACLALGVAAIAGVGSVSSALTRGLAEGGQENSRRRYLHPSHSSRREHAELAAIADGTAVTASAEMRAMARSVAADAARSQTLVELKAVDDLYPLYGAMTLSPAMPLDEALATRGGVPGLVVEPNLLTRLGVDIGEQVRIGDTDFELRATIIREPDRVADGFALGPRAMISRAALGGTGLVQPGSLVEYHYRVRLPADARTSEDIAAWVASLNERFRMRAGASATGATARRACAASWSALRCFFPLSV